MDEANVVHRISNVEACVLSVLRSALEERFRYPRTSSNEPIDDELPLPSEDKSDLIQQLARKLNMAALNRAYNQPMDVQTLVVDGRVQRVVSHQTFDSKDAERAFDDRIDVNGYYAYLTDIASYVVHTSPAFYTGQHCWVWRDMVLRDKLPEGFAHFDVIDLWPEIYDNYRLSQTDYDIILNTVQVDKMTAIKGLVTLIDRCCSKDTCSASQMTSAMQSGGILEDGTAFKHAQHHICFGLGKNCLKAYSNKIVIPCAIEDGACDVIRPEDRSTQTFNTCMRYEQFLQTFAADELSAEVDGEVIGSLGETVTRSTARQIRDLYRKELQMMRRYLDILNQD